MEASYQTRGFKEVIMLFEAKVNKTPYTVNVEENRTEWVITITKENLSTRRISLPKKDFQVGKDGLISLLYDNSSYLVDVIPNGTDYNVFTRGSHRTVSILNDERLLRDSLMGGRGLGGIENLKSGMPGKVVKIFVKPGDEVKAGDPLLIMEAMKMENEMKAAADVIVDKVHVQEGKNIESGALLISFKPPKE